MKDTYPPMKMEQSVPKCRHIKFRVRGITQKKAYNEIRIYKRFGVTWWFSHYSFFSDSRGSTFLWNCSRCLFLYTNGRY